MKKISRTAKLREGVWAVLLAAALLAGLFLTGCGVKPHELLGVETLFEPETFESIEQETTEESSTTAEETTEALPLPHDVVPGQKLPAESLNASNADQFFWQSGISDSIFERINGKSYKDDCNIRDELRYLQVLHYDFYGNVRVGELICNRSVSSDVLYIFHRLYEEKYPVEKILLIDEYDADDESSCADNNSSCFNYRKKTEGSSLSKHAKGLAVDINPLYNPYILSSGTGTVPAGASDYADRTLDFSYKIDENDLCYQLFTEAGFTWGGTWESAPDYMHFEKEK